MKIVKWDGFRIVAGSKGDSIEDVKIFGFVVVKLLEERPLNTS